MNPDPESDFAFSGESTWITSQDFENDQGNVGLERLEQMLGIQPEVAREVVDSVGQFEDAEEKGLER